jgi:hypothetical protein
MLRAAVADAAVIQRSRAFSGRSHQIVDRPIGLIGVDHDHVWQRRQQGNRLKGGQGIVAHIGEQGRVDRQRSGRRNEDGVAVRRGARRRCRPQIAARAGLVLNDEAVAEIVGHAIENDSADDIRRAARREGNDDTDRTLRIFVLSGCRCRDCDNRQASDHRGATELHQFGHERSLILHQTAITPQDSIG